MRAVPERARCLALLLRASLRSPQVSCRRLPKLAFQDGGQSLPREANLSGDHKRAAVERLAKARRVEVSPTSKVAMTEGSAALMTIPE